MRVDAGSAVAARSIARMVWRVDMVCKSPAFSTAKLAKLGKVRVNRLRTARF